MSETRSGDSDRLPVRLIEEDDREEAALAVLSLPRSRSASARCRCEVTIPAVFRVDALEASSNGSVSLRR